MKRKLSLPEKRGDGEERRSIIWLLAALVVVLVLAAAACGGDDDGDEEGAPQDTAADTGGGGDEGGVVTFEPGQDFSSVLLPKQTGVSVFDQANQGAPEAAEELQADTALEILGEEGGEFAILSASADAANQNAWIAAMEEALQDPKYASLELVDTVYGDDDSEKSYDEALGLVDKQPNLKLIMAPTTVGIAAAGKAMTDEGLCDKVKVSGLGLPEEMVEYTLSGCAPQFALWSFVDLGYLAYYTAYGIATGQIEAEEGVQFEAGRLGEYTIEKDPTRDNGLRVLMGPFTVYDETNVEQ